jgi:hypothetical protein
MWVIWNLVSVCLEVVLVSVQDMCTICTKLTTGSEIILDYQVTWVLWNLILVRLETVLMSVRLGTVLILTLDRCTVCA